MKYLEEFSDPELARRLLDDIHRTATQPWAMMEVCGGQTHTIVKQGIDEALPEGRYAMGKIDVEGFETAAFRGARGRLAAADPPFWQIELLDHVIFGHREGGRIPYFSFRDSGSL